MVCIFPTEVLCQILSDASPRDIVRWRTVSKRFCAITYDLEIWKALYAKAAYWHPRELPPISAYDRALVKSERLAQSWIQNPLQPRLLSCTKVPFDGYIRHNYVVGGGSLIGGRWFIVCQSDKSFVLYDSHPDPEMRMDPRLLWKQTDKIIFWHIISTRSREDRWCAYVISAILYPSRTTYSQSRWTLLELWWDAESGLPCIDTVALVVPRDVTYNFPKQFSGHSRFLYLSPQSLVFDTITRLFYEFPTFSLALVPPNGDIVHEGIWGSVMLTDTHVICLRECRDARSRERRSVVVQAFTVPDDQHTVENGLGVLHLSHEGKLECWATGLDVIRNSVIDPQTGSISVRLLERTQDWNYPHEACACIDLTLHKSSQMDVSPMGIRRHDIVVRGCPPKQNQRIPKVLWDIADSGYARGLAECISSEMVDSGDGLRCAWEEVMKFAIDATGDRCIMFYGDEAMEPVIQPGRFPSNHWKFGLEKFDGARGKICYAIYDHGQPVMIVKDIE